MNIIARSAEIECGYRALSILRNQAIPASYDGLVRAICGECQTCFRSRVRGAPWCVAPGNPVSILSPFARVTARSSRNSMRWRAPCSFVLYGRPANRPVRALFVQFAGTNDYSIVKDQSAEPLRRMPVAATGFRETHRIPISGTRAAGWPTRVFICQRSRFQVPHLNGRWWNCYCFVPIRHRK